MDIHSLSRETGVSVRTIRFYLAQKLLSPPSGRGPAAVYSAGHRDRLRLIRRLQDAQLPLARIRDQLDALDDAGVAAALAEPIGPQDPAPADAADYVKQVLAGSGRHQQGSAGMPDSVAAPTPVPQTPARSSWERIVLRPDIELHVRRPLARADQRRLEALLAQAERLFNDDG